MDTYSNNRSMKRIIYIVTLLAFAISTFAAQITGKVLDMGTKQPIDFANISVVKQGESTPIGGTITDETGAFAIEIPDGQYTIIVSFMG